MTTQLPLHFPTVTAPRFEDSPTAYAVWLLEIKKISPLVFEVGS